MAGSKNAKEYNYLSVDNDEDFLGIPTRETDLSRIINMVVSSDQVKQVKSMDDLVGAWMYIARLQSNDGHVLYCVRKISELWSKKKTQPLVQLLYKDQILVDLDDEQIFRIDNKIDFFSFEGVIFIADKPNFETALNFRAGMENNRDTIISEFKGMNLFVDADEVARLVGDNTRRLRKLSQVKNQGYYMLPEFLHRLKQVSYEKSWGIQYDNDGKLVATEDNIDTILRVLNNDRLESPLNDETFDVDVKHKIN